MTSENGITSLGELRVPAQLENLRIISSFVNAVGQRLNLTEKTLFDIELAVDEAANNVVKHAYPDANKGDLIVKADIVAESMQLTLIDWGLRFDTAQVRPFQPDEPLESRIAGGMGFHFIKQVMDDVTYTRVDGTTEYNELVLVKNIERMQPGTKRASPTRELHALMNVTEAITDSADLDHLLGQIIDQLVSTIGAERGTLYLVDSESGELVSSVLMEDRATLREIHLKLGEGIAGHVAQTGQVVNVEDAYADERFNPDYDQLTGFACKTMLVAPMRNPQGQIIGVVQLINKRGGMFSARDERLLTAVSAQAAISVENARLYEREIQQQLIERELTTARAIQTSFLPEAIPQYEGWDVGVLWHPMRAVAGDFYDFDTLPDGRLALLIADVSGKGIPAALFMALSVMILRFAMQLSLSPAGVLRRANHVMISNQASRMFTTAFLAYVDLDNGEVACSSAGHNPPLLYRAGTGTLEPVNVLGVAMGVFEEAYYNDHTLSLEPGDMLVMYTDGITEIVNGAGEEFGEARLKQVVQFHAETDSSQEIADAVRHAIQSHAAENGAFDDETILVLKRT